MKILCLSCVILLCTTVALPIICNCQDTLRYCYDEAGNRVVKEITIRQSKKSSQIDNVTSPDELIMDNTFKDQLIRIYPNPTSGRITIDIKSDTDNPEAIDITILDFNGRKIIESRNVPEKIDFDLSTCPRGVYLLNIKRGNLVSQWKIIKQ